MICARNGLSLRVFFKIMQKIKKYFPKTEPFLRFVCHIDRALKTETHL